jgi:O-antigen/teichoic acid export membrane protein
VNYRSLAKNAGTAFLAQGVAMGLSIIQTLLVPKLLGTTEYGYWQLFIFYQGYKAFAHLGLVDGVYLIHGGESRNAIDKKVINSQFVVGVLYESIFAVIIVCIAVFGGFGSDREFVIACTGIYFVIQGAADFLSYLLQAMNETRKSSYSTIVERLTFLVPLLILLVTRCQSFRPFVVAYMFSSVVQFVYCALCCKDFMKSGLIGFTDAIRETWGSIRVGFKLMMAGIASQLILGVARFAIDAEWGIQTFGELSFTLSMVNFFLAFVNQASMVLFPALRQTDEEEARRFFANVRDTMSLFFPVIYVLYYPMVWLLSLWLPKYAGSLIYFAFLIPICVFDSKMNICCTTFFKVLREEGTLLWVNVATCVASALFTLIGIKIFQSIYIVIGGVVVSIVGRSIWSEARLSKELSEPETPALTIAELAITLVFVLATLTLPALAALAVYCCAYVFFLFLFRKRARGLLSKLGQLKKH